VHEHVEVALPRDHRLAGQVDQRPSVPLVDGVHARALPHRLPEVGPLAPQRGSLPRDVPGADERPRPRPRRRARAGTQPQRQVDLLEELLLEELVRPERLEPPREERAVRLAGGLHAADPLAQRERRLVERRRLCVVREEREPLEQQLLLLHGELVPIDEQPVAPPPGDPPRRAREEAVADVAAGDAGVGKRFRVAPEVAARCERREHALHLRENRGVVGVRAEEAEHFVQPLHRARTAEPFALERLQQRDLLRGRVRTVFRADRLEPPQRVHGADYSLSRRRLTTPERDCRLQETPVPRRMPRRAMKCRDFHHLVEGCRQAGPSPYERALIEWHLRHCARCSAAVRGLRTERKAARHPVSVSST